MSILNSIKFYTKSVVFGVLIAACGFYGLVASIILRLVGKGEYAQWTVARAFYHSFLKILGVTIVIKNEELLLRKPAIVISNHQTALDILILGKIFQPGYTVTAKKVLKFFPFLGWFMLASGTFFIDRKQGEKARKVLDAALATLRRDKKALFMFPEGTRSASQKLDLLPFKKGAFHLAKQAQIPIIPVVVSNYSRIFNAKDRVFNRGEIVLEVLEPMPTDGLKTNDDVTAFAADVHEKMLEKLQEIEFARTSSEIARGKVPEVEDEEQEPISDINTDSDEEVISEETPLVSKS